MKAIPILANYRFFDYLNFILNQCLFSAACGGAYTASNGLITSPNYPSFHPLDIDCSYRITVATGNKIQLYFRDFNIEAHSNCIYDFLEIRDGSTATAPLIGNRTWCGTVAPPASFSTGNTLFMRFKSDLTVQNAGFAVSYTSSVRSELILLLLIFVLVSGSISL